MQSQKLIEIILSNLKYADKTQTFSGDIRDCLQALPSEEYLTHLNFMETKTEHKFYRLMTSFQLYSTFYNQTSQQFEPLIEPWDLKV